MLAQHSDAKCGVTAHINALIRQRAHHMVEEPVNERRTVRTKLVAHFRDGPHGH